MATDWSKLKVVDLKAELKRLGLPQNGLKAELVARLEAADSEKAASQPSDESAEEAQDLNSEPGPGPGPEQTSPEAEEAEEAPEVTQPAPPDESSLEQVEATPAAQEMPAPTTLTAAETQATEATLAPSSSGETPLQPTEVVQDSQKRKRRSLSPAPSAEEVVRKRARQESSDGQEDNVADSGEITNARAEPQEEMEDVTQAAPDVEMQGTKDEPSIERERDDDGERAVLSNSADDDRPGDQNGHTAEVVVNDTQATLERPPEHEPAQKQAYVPHPTEVERDVEPSIHPATSALYIKNFMRPLRPQAVKEHLLDLATPAGTSIENSTILDFYLDTIRTHAFVVFNSISAASRVRTALHNRVWPDETNRKALWVDFMPPERFAEWVDMEQASAGGRGATSRYEVTYDSDDDGNVIVKLEEFDTAGPAAKQVPLAPEPQPERKLSIPTGPSRSFAGIEGAPTGPRGFNSNRGPAVHPRGTGRLDLSGQSTRALPPVTYQPVPDELVRRRLDTIAAAKTKDSDRDFGKEYKRYYFENGDVLVDRGPEIFLGIRPPHRERERQREQQREHQREHQREQRREPGRSRRTGGGGRRRGGMPIFHGVPRGGDRFRPGDSSASGTNGRSRYADDRGSRRDGRYGGDDRGSRRDGYGRY